MSQKQMNPEDVVEDFSLHGDKDGCVFWYGGVPISLTVARAWLLYSRLNVYLNSLDLEDDKKY